MLKLHLQILEVFIVVLSNINVILQPNFHKITLFKVSIPGSLCKLCFITMPLKNMPYHQHTFVTEFSKDYTFQDIHFWESFKILFLYDFLHINGYVKVKISILGHIWKLCFIIIPLKNIFLHQHTFTTEFFKEYTFLGIHFW